MFCPDFAGSFRRRRRWSPIFTCQTLPRAASIRVREKQSVCPGLTAIRAPRQRVRAPSGRSSRWWVHLSSTSPTTLPVRSFCSACCWDDLYAAFCARLAGCRSCFTRFPAKSFRRKGSRRLRMSNTLCCCLLWYCCLCWWSTIWGWEIRSFASTSVHRACSRAPFRWRLPMLEFDLRWGSSLLGNLSFSLLWWC